jgi:hypothetical protein
MAAHFRSGSGFQAKFLDLQRRKQQLWSNQAREFGYARILKKIFRSRNSDLPVIAYPLQTRKRCSKPGRKSENSPPFCNSCNSSLQYLLSSEFRLSKKDIRRLL